MRGLWLIIISSLLVSCNYRVEKKSSESSGALGEPAGSAFIETKLIQSFVLNSCMGCHSGKNQPILNTESLLQQNAEKVWNSVSKNAMPPPESGYPSLSNCRKALLRKWIDLGFPSRSDITVNSLVECQSSPGEAVDLPIEQMPLNYQTLLTKVLQPKCMNCHNPQELDSLASEILFSPLSEIQGNRRWKAPGATSSIVQTLKRTDDKRMPPMNEGEPLSAQEIDFIIRWIDAGQPEN